MAVGVAVGAAVGVALGAGVAVGRAVAVADSVADGAGLGCAAVVAAGAAVGGIGAAWHPPDSIRITKSEKRPKRGKRTGMDLSLVFFSTHSRVDTSYGFLSVDYFSPG